MKTISRKTWHPAADYITKLPEHAINTATAYSCSSLFRWKRLRKSDFANLKKRFVKSYSFLSEEMSFCSSSSGNNDGCMYFCDIIICYFWFLMLYPYTNACRLYSRHRGFLRFCLSGRGICHTAHSCADISIRSGHNPNALLVLMIQYSVRSFF